VGPVGVRPHLAGVQDIQEVLARPGPGQAPFFIGVAPGKKPYTNGNPCKNKNTSWKAAISAPVPLEDLLILGDQAFLLAPICHH